MGGVQANPRAQPDAGNSEGPDSAAPGARLLDGLQRPSRYDVDGYPEPHFQPGTGRRHGEGDF